MIEAVVKGVGITQFMRIAIEDELATGRLNVVLPEIPMFTTPVYVLHAFERQLPLRARLFIDFLVEALEVSRLSLNFRTGQKRGPLARSVSAMGQKRKGSQ